MKKPTAQTRALIRSCTVIAATLAVVGGVTYAAIQSQARLLGNTIETTSADLQVSTDSANFASRRPGFDFPNVVPGGSAVPDQGNVLYLQNIGTSPLAIKVAVPAPPSNPQNVDLTKVYLLITPHDGQQQSFSIQDLINANASGGLSLTTPNNVGAGATTSFALRIQMAADAVHGSSASLSNFDLAFNGVTATN